MKSPEKHQLLSRKSQKYWNEYNQVYDEILLKRKGASHRNTISTGNEDSLTPQKPIEKAPPKELSPPKLEVLKYFTKHIMPEELENALTPDEKKNLFQT